MPNAQTNPKINARRFAALLAGFDLGNGSEEEALAKARVLRRMAADAGMRVVDVMELPEVKQAIDDQLRPAREESPALREAVEHAAALHEELTERTRDVRLLAERLGRQEEEMERMRREYAGAGRPANAARSPRPPAPRAGNNVIPGWSVQLGAVVMALVMLLCSLLGNSHGGKGNGLGESQGVSAAGVHEDGAVRPVPKRGSLHHRKRRRASGADASQLRGVPVPNLHVQPEVR